MVLYDNIKIGQRVEVRWQGWIEPGTIKYKGALNGVRGEWVGVALDRKGDVGLTKSVDSAVYSAKTCLNTSKHLLV